MGRNQARAVLLGSGQPSAAVLQALRVEIGLSDLDLGGVVGGSAAAVRGWRLVDVPGEPPKEIGDAIENLRIIAGKGLRAGFAGRSIKSFLLSRNTGLGLDRPVDGMRPGSGAFWRVEDVTDCWIGGRAPVPGPSIRSQ